MSDLEPRQDLTDRLLAAAREHHSTADDAIQRIAQSPGRDRATMEACQAQQACLDEFLSLVGILALRQSLTVSKVRELAQATRNLADDHA
jgi:hypothetical protein